MNEAPAGTDHRMRLTGEMLIGASCVPGTAAAFHGVDPSTGLDLQPAYGGAGPEHVERACAMARAAFTVYRSTGLEERALFLETIAQGLVDLGETLIARVCLETGLTAGRIEIELNRTVGQLRLFADEVRRGGWLDGRIDLAQPDRKPQPRSDLRLRNVPLGPVAVFGASNFPLAFSVAGGDTASALAAGCPVVVKAHPAHPGTSEMVGRVIQQAVARCGLPEGVFSLLFGIGNWLGGALVADPRIKAVGFTGSRGGGLALIRIAQERPVPIPVYAEMSSINPVVLLPEALAGRAEAIGKGFAASLTMGAGQFCTNPGLVLAIDGPGLDQFVAATTEALVATTAATMLTPGIFQAFQRGVDRLCHTDNVALLARGKTAGEAVNRGQAALFATTADDFQKDASLSEEVFGASSLLIRCRGLAELQAALEDLEGQLTVTLQMDDGDLGMARTLLPTLEEKAGRLLVNGWPTGVEVSHAMVHGGPFPATADGRSTSVGTMAIRRFLRPVCYQDVPQGLLPQALKDGNPDGIPLTLHGVITTA